MNIANPKNRILVIDDNKAIHEDFKKILTRAKADDQLADTEAALFGETAPVFELPEFEIASAFQGREGFEMVGRSVHNKEPYAMAFIDVRMPPGWDGIETTAQIWKVDPDLQVVICTAYSDYSLDEMIAKLGQSDRLVILKKPFDNIEVSQLAFALTKKWELLQQSKQRFRNLENVIKERASELLTTNQVLLSEIAERKRSESERRLMEAQLHQSQKLEAIGQLAAGIAHEINTPAQYIGDNTRFVKDSFDAVAKILRCHEELLAAAQKNALTPELLSRAQEVLAVADLHYLYEQIPAAIKETLEGVDRVTKIVRAMKEFSHPANKEKAPADLNRAIESTVTVARNEWKYVAETKLELDPQLPPVPCFIGEFNQSILNLVVNAAHAIGDVVKKNPGSKGLITIQTRRDGDYVEIRVSDTGTGIPEQLRRKIFEPFFTTKEVGVGTGQGLAIVYASIVKKHKGQVKFETEVGRGTTFILRLPISENGEHFSAHEISIVTATN